MTPPPPAPPRISVVIANFNHGHFIGAAVASVLAQRLRPHEIIVVDDGSTDDSPAVLATLPVRVIRQENQGQARALQAGVEAATGDVICLLDADDGWDPEKLDRVAQVFARRPACQWLRHKLALVDEGLRPLGATQPRFSGSRRLPVSLLSAGERLANVSTSALAFRRGVAAELFPLPRVRHDADAFLVARLNARHEGYQLDEALGWYRRHAGQQFQPGDVERVLERQVEVSAMVAVDVGWSEPVSVHKHRAVLAALGGRPRAGHAWRGARAVARLVTTPRAMVRQGLGLALAVCAPRLWMARLRRNDGT